MRITEVLKTIQGELNMIGYPIVLIRFTGCNLRCSWCDAYEASHLNIDNIRIDDQQLIDVADRIINLSDGITTALLTGGEPTLYLTNDHQKFFNRLADYFDKFIIETNGLAEDYNVYQPENLKKFFKDKEIYIDCSPKLNLDAYKLYDNIKSINDIFNLYQLTIPIIMKNKNYTIKMVYNKNYEQHILRFKERFNIPFERFCVLPFTPVVKGRFIGDNFLEKYKESCKKAVEFCIKNNIVYSPREHIFLFHEAKNEFEKLI